MASSGIHTVTSTFTQKSWNEFKYKHPCICLLLFDTSMYYYTVLTSYFSDTVRFVAAEALIQSQIYKNMNQKCNKFTIQLSNGQRINDYA